eukprot:GHVP01054011.1.p1 GENE.GHVP01054011.1~~GHVP01054011.1.p1  ORF type:complete len:1124 (-),score=201.36 GHVP01054011.1:75-3446(-)
MPVISTKQLICELEGYINTNDEKLPRIILILFQASGMDDREAFYHSIISMKSSIDHETYIKTIYQMITIESKLSVECSDKYHGMKGLEKLLYSIIYKEISEVCSFIIDFLYEESVGYPIINLNEAFNILFIHSEITNNSNLIDRLLISMIYIIIYNIDMDYKNYIIKYNKIKDNDKYLYILNGILNKGFIMSMANGILEALNIIIGIIDENYLLGMERICPILIGGFINLKTRGTTIVLIETIINKNKGGYLFNQKKKDRLITGDDGGLIRKDEDRLIGKDGDRFIGGEELVDNEALIENDYQVDSKAQQTNTCKVDTKVQSANTHPVDSNAEDLIIRRWNIILGLIKGAFCREELNEDLFVLLQEHSIPFIFIQAALDALRTSNLDLLENNLCLGLIEGEIFLSEDLFLYFIDNILVSMEFLRVPLNKITQNTEIRTKYIIESLSKVISRKCLIEILISLSGSMVEENEINIIKALAIDRDIVKDTIEAIMSLRVEKKEILLRAICDVSCYEISKGDKEIIIKVIKWISEQDSDLVRVEAVTDISNVFLGKYASTELTSFLMDDVLENILHPISAAISDLDDFEVLVSLRIIDFCYRFINQSYKIWERFRIEYVFKGGNQNRLLYYSQKLLISRDKTILQDQIKDRETLENIVNNLYEHYPNQVGEGVFTVRDIGEEIERCYSERLDMKSEVTVFSETRKKSLFLMLRWKECKEDYIRLLRKMTWIKIEDIKENPEITKKLQVDFSCLRWKRIEEFISIKEIPFDSVKEIAEFFRNEMKNVKEENVLRLLHVMDKLSKRDESKEILGIILEGCEFFINRNDIENYSEIGGFPFQEQYLKHKEFIGENGVIRRIAKIMIKDSIGWEKAMKVASSFWKLESGLESLSMFTDELSSSLLVDNREIREFVVFILRKLDFSKEKGKLIRNRVAENIIRELEDQGRNSVGSIDVKIILRILGSLLIISDSYQCLNAKRILRAIPWQEILAENIFELLYQLVIGHSRMDQRVVEVLLEEISRDSDKKIVLMKILTGIEWEHVDDGTIQRGVSISSTYLFSNDREMEDFSIISLDNIKKVSETAVPFYGLIKGTQRLLVARKNIEGIGKGFSLENILAAMECEISTENEG